METLKIGNREVQVKELKYKDLLTLAELPKAVSAKKLILFGSDLKEEEYEQLSVKDGLTLQNNINEINDLTDFQTPLEE